MYRPHGWVARVGICRVVPRPLTDLGIHTVIRPGELTPRFDATSGLGGVNSGAMTLSRRNSRQRTGMLEA